MCNEKATVVPRVWFAQKDERKLSALKLATDTHGN